MHITAKHINKLITNPAILEPTVFIGIGAGKMALDYQKAQENQKRKVLVKDAAILAGSVAGFALMNPLTSLLCKKYLIGVQNNIVKNTEFVLKQSISAVLNTFSGVFGAVCANELMHKYVLNKEFFCPPPVWNEDNIETEKAKSIFKNFVTITPNVATKAANRVVSNISDIPSMRIFSAPMIALTGFSVANTDGHRNKLKKTTNEIIANSLIPTMCVSIVSLFVNNKKNIIKIPVLIAALALGSYTGMFVADKAKQGIDKTIDSLDLSRLALK